MAPPPKDQQETDDIWSRKKSCKTKSLPGYVEEPMHFSRYPSYIKQLNITITYKALRTRTFNWQAPVYKTPPDLILFPGTLKPLTNLEIVLQAIKQEDDKPLYQRETTWPAFTVSHSIKIKKILSSKDINLESFERIFPTD